MGTCRLCSNNQTNESNDESSDLIKVQCNNCGKYVITRICYEDFDSFWRGKEDKRHLISGYVREMNDLGDEAVLIGMKNIDDILSSPLIPKKLDDKLDKLLLHFFRITRKIGEEFLQDYDDMRASCYAIDYQEAIAIYDTLDEALLLDCDKYTTAYRTKLTIKGYVAADEIEKEVSNSTTVFAAMWFTQEMQEIFMQGIKPAIESEEIGMGFNAFKIDNYEHNNDICDEIIANIKQSRFLIADFTGNRYGVYYEAGFARGLGIPVIHTCREDFFKGDDKIHFDLEHMNFIIWKDVDELKRKLINRIKATIL